MGTRGADTDTGPSLPGETIAIPIVTTQSNMACNADGDWGAERAFSEESELELEDAGGVVISGASRKYNGMHYVDFLR